MHDFGRVAGNALLRSDFFFLKQVSFQRTTWMAAASSEVFVWKIRCQTRSPKTLRLAGRSRQLSVVLVKR